VANTAAATVIAKQRPKVDIFEILRHRLFGLIANL